MTATATLPTSLADVLAYRHEGVIKRYVKEQGVSQEEATEVFRETLKWLYLCYRNALEAPDSPGCTMTPDILKLDEMWHTFVLFTMDYAEFCERYFGFFLHHVPNQDDDEVQLEESAVREQLEHQYALVYDVLGEETLTAWHDDCKYGDRS